MIHSSSHPPFIPSIQLLSGDFFYRHLSRMLYRVVFLSCHECWIVLYCIVLYFCPTSCFDSDPGRVLGPCDFQPPALTGRTRSVRFCSKNSSSPRTPGPGCCGRLGVSRQLKIQNQELNRGPDMRESCTLGSLDEEYNAVDLIQLRLEGLLLGGFLLLTVHLADLHHKNREWRAIVVRQPMCGWRDGIHFKI